MSNAYKRKKQPEQIRRALIEQAARLAVEQGLTAVTVQAVSAAAGVTKGGFTHHFPSKQALIDAVFHELLSSIERELDERIAADPEPYGSFTRAYVKAAFDLAVDGKGGPWGALMISMLTDPDLRALWGRWLEERLRRHRSTDSDLALFAVRLAADGVWLADISGISIPERATLQRHLLQATKPTAP